MKTLYKTGVVFKKTQKFTAPKPYILIHQCTF